jgi:hypothetical protein
MNSFISFSLNDKWTHIKWLAQNFIKDENYKWCKSTRLEIKGY